MAKFETRHSQFGLISGIARPASDMALVVEAAGLFAPEARKGHLYIVTEAGQDAVRSHDACQIVSRTIRKAFYDDSSFSVTSSLRKAIIAANRALYQHNFSAVSQKRGTVGVTCAVIKGEDLYIAQVSPTQAYVLSDGKLRALPASLAWNPAQANVIPMLRLNALGASLTVEPEFYRSVLRPGDAVLLCSSNLGRLLGQEETLRLLRAADPSDVVEKLIALCKQNAVAEAHALAIGFFTPLSPAAQAAPLSRVGLAERGMMALRSAGDWVARATGEAALMVRGPAARMQRARSESRRARAAEEERQLTTLPEEPRLSPNPPSLPRPLDMGEPLEERAESERQRAVGALPARPIETGRVPPSLLLGEPTYGETAQPERRIDLSYTTGAQSRQSVPPLEPTLGERLTQPFAQLGGFLEGASRRRRLRRPPPRAAQAMRRPQGLSYRRQSPPFPWVWLLLLVSLVAVLFLYGINLSNENAQREADNSMELAEQAVAAIYASPDEETALERLDAAAQAIAEVRSTTLVTATLDSRRRFEGLEREYERAVAALHRISYFEQIDEFARNPLPGALFDSVVVPPPPRGITETLAFGSIYLLDANAGTLYRMPKTGGTVQPILRPDDVVDGLEVGRVRAIDWRLDTIVAVTQSGAGAGYNYFFQSGDRWRYSILAGSEEWGGNPEHFRAANYEGNLYVWGATPGNVLRYLSGNYGSFPEPWIQNDGGKKVDSAIDIAVDGKIYLLQPDGRILVFASDEVTLERAFEREIVPDGIRPPLVAVSRFFVTGDPDSGSIFLVDGANDRIIQIDKQTGAFIQQIRAQPDSPIQLDQLISVFVDDTPARPVLYMVNGAQILRAELPDRPSPFREASGTPGPRQTPTPTSTP